MNILSEYELLPAVPSRNWENDEDLDSEDCRNKVEESPTWKWLGETPEESTLTCEKLLVAITPAARILAESIFLRNEKTQPLSQFAHLQSPSGKTQIEFYKKGIPGHDVSLVVAVVKVEQLEGNTFLYASAIEKHIIAEKMVMLDAIPLWKFNLEDVQPPILRCLCTQNWDSSESVDLCPFLEPPNFITGLAAAMLTLRRGSGKPAIVYITISEHSGFKRLSIETVQAFQPVSLKFGWYSRDDIPSVEQLCKEQLNFLTPDFAHLYI